MPTNLITLTDVDSLTDQALELSNTRVVRKHGVAPGDWDILRLGVRMSCMRDPADTYAGTPELYVGFCNGDDVAVDAPPASAAAHGLYYKTNISTWTSATNGTTKAMQAFATTACVQHNVAGVESTVTMSVDGRFYIANHEADKWTSYMFFELEKTTKTGNLGTVFTVRSGTFDGITGTHKTRAKLIEQMEITTFSSINDCKNSVKTAVAASEVTNGEFDSVFVAWNKSAMPIRIHDMMTSIIAAP